MTNEELAVKMQENTADREFAEELQEVLQAELQKPAEEQDYDLICDLTQTLSEMCGADEMLSEHSNGEIARLREDTEPLKQKSGMIRLRWLIPAACALLLLFTNILSYAVFGMNAFSAAVWITDGGIMIRFKEDEQPLQENTNKYAEEMLAFCQENGFSPLVPQYIPEKLEPAEDWKNIAVLDKTTTATFHFTHKKEKLAVSYTFLPDPSFELEVGMPFGSDASYSTETICGVNVNLIQSGKTEYRAAFRSGQVIYSIWTDGLDEAEFRKILCSLFSE